MKNMLFKKIGYCLLSLCLFISCQKATNEHIATSLTGLKARPTANTVLLSWDLVNEANKYEIQIEDKSYVSASENFTIQNLLPEKTYAWKVRAITDDTTTDWVSSTFTTTKVAPTHWEGKWYTENFDAVVQLDTNISFSLQKIYPDNFGYPLVLSLNFNATSENLYTITLPQEFIEMFPIPDVSDLNVLDEDLNAFISEVGLELTYKVNKPLKIANLFDINKVNDASAREFMKEAYFTQISLNVSNYDIGLVHLGDNAAYLKYKIYTKPILKTDNESLNVMLADIFKNADMYLTSNIKKQ